MVRYGCVRECVCGKNLALTRADRRTCITLHSCCWPHPSSISTSHYMAGHCMWYLALHVPLGAIDEARSGVSRDVGYSL